LKTITSVSGNTVDARGEPISVEQILEVFEKYPLEFNEKGEVIPPLLVMGPAVHKIFMDLKPTTEQQSRMNEIIERKRTEFNAGKRSRRLS